MDSAGILPNIGTPASKQNVFVWKSDKTFVSEPWDVVRKDWENARNLLQIWNYRGGKKRLETENKCDKVKHVLVSKFF